MDLSFSKEEQAFAAEVQSWLAANLERPDALLSLEEEVAWGRGWQAKLAAARWVGLHWPQEYGGRGASPAHVAIFNAEYARAGAPQPVNRVGINLAGPTLLAHGTEQQKRRWLAPILTADELWCQLFSEPGAGSDLASVSTRGIPVEGGWMVSGQKVWTSYAQFARWGICLARTETDAPRHRGISFLVVDMTASGIEIRPLVQITGEADFNEVFLTDVFVPEEQLVGARGDGWRVALTTLAHERGTNFPFKEQVVHEIYLEQLYRQAATSGLLDQDSDIVDGLAEAYVQLAVLRLHNWRTLSRLGQGVEPGPESSTVKLAWTSMTQHLSEVAMAVVGPDASWPGPWGRQWLWSKAASIAGGTSEIQRTIIAERLLGLPRA